MHLCACTHPRAPVLRRTHARMNTTQYVILIAFHGNTVFVNAPHCYVIRTLPLLLVLEAEWVDPETEAKKTELYLMFRKQEKVKSKMFFECLDHISL